jgi:drug/metabolite transporter (DMT)-like permease
MLNTLLYLGTILIWGSTWFVIKFQLGVVSPSLSVAYRFAIASALLFMWCAMKKFPLRYSLQDHVFMALQGFFLFGTNYHLAYGATHYLTSGINAVLFSSVMIFNIFNAFLFLKTPVTLTTALGATLGLAGIATVFWPEIASVQLAETQFVGMAYSVGGAVCASFGNLISAKLQKRALPITITNAFGMGYGSLLTFLYLFAVGQPIQFDFSKPYVLSLIYLSIVGSMLAFGCYLSLLGRIGPQRAAYALILTPIVALAVSTLFENYSWSAFSFAGILLILIGNILIMLKPRNKIHLSPQKL